MLVVRLQDASPFGRACRPRASAPTPSARGTLPAVGSKAAKRRTLKEAARETALLRRAARQPGAIVITAEDVSLHEAAHAVAAAGLLGPLAIESVHVDWTAKPTVRRASELGLPGTAEPHSCDLVDDPELKAEVDKRTPPSQQTDTIRKRARARLLLNQAGVYGAELGAHGLLMRRIPPSESDARNARLMALFLTGFDESEADRVESAVDIETRAFVQQYAAQIRLVGGELERSGSLTGADVGALMAS